MAIHVPTYAALYRFALHMAEVLPVTQAAPDAPGTWPAQEVIATLGEQARGLVADPPPPRCMDTPPDAATNPGLYREPDGSPAHDPIWIVMTNDHRWGKGFTREQATQAASLKRGQDWIAYRSTDPHAFIDGMGAICWDAGHATWKQEEHRRRTKR